jgi:cytidylate kinase
MMPPVVTLSASYGAGGSLIGPLVAEALGVPFVDRAITTALAEKLGMEPEAVAARDDVGPTRMDRMLASLAAIGGLTGADVATDLADRGFMKATEEIVRGACGERGGVVLGRAAAVVLAEREGALHVRLDGPRERRIRAAMEIEGIDRQTAERRAADNDAARCGYVRYFYGVDAADPQLYDLVIDATRLPAATVAAVIAEAARALAPA